MALQGRHSLGRGLFWPISLALAWIGLVVLSHQTTLWAIVWTHRLFGCMLLATYVGLWGWLLSLAQHRRRRLFQGLTCTFMLLVMLGILELPALLKLVHWRLLMQQATGDVQQAYRLDPELGFRRRPYDRWVGRPASDIESGWIMPPSLQEPLVFTYDQGGYRNPADLEKAVAILIGDSYVEGAYVSDDQTVARRLRIHLERPVANLGIEGYGPMQEMRVLKRDGLRYQPKTVI